MPTVCPQCGAPLVRVDGSDRTVWDGTWYEVYCARCGYRADAFKPRRSKKKQ